MKRLLFLSAAIAILCSFMSIEWVSITLDQRVSIEFPQQPTTRQINGTNALVTDFENGRLMTTTLDFADFGMDSTSLAESLKDSTSLAQFRDGVLEKMPGSSLVWEKNGTTQGQRSFEFLFKIASTDSKFDRLYNKNVFVGAKMFTLYFYENASDPQEANRTRFMNSLKVK